MSNYYRYEGPVMAFDRCIQNYWTAQTYASSEKKARSNLAYRYKMETGRVASSNISLPGKLVIIS